MNTEGSDRELRAGDYRSLARFRHALRVFLRFSEDAARDVGLTPSQHQLLLAVAGSDRAPSLSDVADGLQLKLHSVGELVGRAMEKDLVDRQPDPADNRRVLLYLTERGSRLLARLSVQHREELRRFRTEMNAVLRELER